LNDSFFDFKRYNIPTLENPEITKHKLDKICVVISKEDFSNHQELLSKILYAIKFDLAKNVRLIQLSENGHIKLNSEICGETKEILCFGISPSRISMNASFKANVFYATEKFEIMLAHSLSKLTEDVAKKKALWNALQSKYLN